MATRPDTSPDSVPAPDRIEPQSPDELPAPQQPDEAPMDQPDEVGPVGPDFDQPDSAPVEMPPPD